MAWSSLSLDKFPAAHRAAVGFAFLLLTAIGARADEIVTTDGRVLSGGVRLTKTAVRVDRGDELKWADVVSARWIRPDFHPITSGVILTDGSALAGKVTGIDDHGVTVQPVDSDAVTIPIDKVARVLFSAFDNDRLKPLADGQVTAILTDGDSFAGTVQSYDQKNVTMDSAVLGPTPFETGTKVAAIFWRQSTRLQGETRITLADGTDVIAEKIEPAGDAVDRLQVTARGIGTIRVAVARVVSIDRAGPGVVDAADLRPTAVGGGEVARVFAVDRATDGLSTRVVGAQANRVVCLSGGTVTFAVPDGCDFFTARLAVPADLLPSSAVVLSVVVDDKTVESLKRYSVDDPATVMVPVDGHRTITLKVEAAKGTGAVGLLLDPVFLKHVDRPKPPAPTSKPITKPTTTPAAASQALLIG